MSTYHIDYDEGSDFQQHLFIKALVAATAADSDDLSAARKMDLTLLASGAKIDTNRFFEEIDDNWERSVQDRAREIAEAHLQDRLEPLQKTIDDLQDVLNKVEGNLRERLGLVKDSWDNWEYSGGW